MKNTILISLIALLLSVSGSIKAQEYDQFFTLGYNTALPLGETSDYIDEFSWRGINLDVKYFVKRNITLGINGGWNVFHSNSGGVVSESVTVNDQVLTLSAKQYRYINALPIYFTGSYIADLESVMLYAGTGIGGQYVAQRIQMGQYIIEYDEFQFAVSPHAGVYIPLNYYMMVNVGVQYNQSFTSSDAVQLSNLAFNVGLTWGK